MNRLQVRKDVLDTDLSIYDICLELKMDKEGSSDPLDESTKQQYINYLLTIIRTWEVEHGSVCSVAFDFAVRNLILTTIDMVDVWPG